MIQKLKAKVTNKKGFTLAELLIVVAILAVLVAIAIPVFTANLDSAKASVDDANFRTAQTVAAAAAMDTTGIINGVSFSAKAVYFDETKGTFVEDANSGYTAQSDNGKTGGKVGQHIVRSGDTVQWG